MKHAAVHASLWLCMMLTACGAADAPRKVAALQPGQAPASVQSAAASVARDSAEVSPPRAGMPDSCDSKSGKICLPPGWLSHALCDRDYPTIALAMFAKQSPWTRGYLRTKTRAWNASGGGSSNEMMAFDEEVIVLRHRKAKKGGIQVSGAGESYDVVRWDGGCVTLASHEMTLTPPPRPMHARIIFKRLELDVRDVLKRVDSIRPAYLKNRKECKGVSMGRVSMACVKADAALSQAIAKHVRDTGGVPEPKKLPARR
jgi:hypothetical protein